MMKWKIWVNVSFPNKPGTGCTCKSSITAGRIAAPGAAMEPSAKFAAPATPTAKNRL